jgi:CRISPR-associated protein Cmr6
MIYPLPHDSQNAFLKYQNKSPQNAGLIFDRFAPDCSRDAKLKKDGLEAVRQAAEKADKNLLAAWRERWQSATKAANTPQPFTLKTDWRLIAGLGRKGPLEVGFTFNRYGFPVIPGSSLKGLARAWGFFQIVEKLAVKPELWSKFEQILQGQWQSELAEWARQQTDRQGRPELWVQLQQTLALTGEAGIKAQQKALTNLLAGIGGDEPAQWQTIFGTQDEAGRAVFFDAIPAHLPKLELDIMNPHYPDYYGGDAPPTDWQSPIPVYFLAIAPQTEFCFAVGWRGTKADESLRQVAENWLKAGLIELGAGSKTSAGYGYFRGEVKAAVVQEKTISTQLAPPVNEPSKPAQPSLTRRGTIFEIRPDKRFGRVRDDETGQEYRFSTEVITGNTPAKKTKVIFEIQGSRVTKVRKD